MRTLLLSATFLAIVLSVDFDDGINFRILRKNYLNKGLAGGLRFGVGYGVPLSSLDPAHVSFKKFVDGRYVDVAREELGRVEVRRYEEAYCDSDHESDYEVDDGEVDDGCFPALKGFISVKRAECELAGRYVIVYGDASRRFNIVVRQCGSRYDWFEDSYWSDGETDTEFDSYYNTDSNGTFLGVNEDNFLNNGLIGGFRVRVGADQLDVDKLHVYKEGSDALPEGMTLDKKIFEHTCNDLSDDSSADDSSSEREQVCKAALYGFVTAQPASCVMDGDYYLEYDGARVEFDVHVKSCGKDDWDEYESDYMYDSEAEYGDDGRRL